MKHNHQVPSIAPETQPASLECRGAYVSSNCLKHFPLQSKPRLTTEWSSCSWKVDSLEMFYGLELLVQTFSALGSSALVDKCRALNIFGGFRKEVK